MDHINSWWETYRDQALPENASPRQKLEAKLGFYAGCTALFAQLGKRMEDDNFSNSDGQKFIGDINRELSHFVDNLDSLADEFDKGLTQ